MKLSKSDAQTDMDMNMTPMIDVVFLLIIFFMIITDMTQQELEDLKLPTAQYAIPDKPDPKEMRPIVNIGTGGDMKVKRELVYDPETDGDDYKELRAWLHDVAVTMKRDEEFEKLPGEPLLIRADMNTPFKYVQKLMEQCGYKDVQIWKLQLAVAEPDDPNKKKD